MTKLRRKDGDRAQTWLLIASDLYMPEARSVKLQACIDRCDGTLCDERWRIPFSGTRFHYCTRPDSHECPHRVRDWVPSPEPVMLDAIRTARVRNVPVYREMHRFLLHTVAKYSLEAGEIGCVARALIDGGKWAQVDYYASSRADDDWQVRTRERAQTRLYERVANDWAIHRKALDDDAFDAYNDTSAMRPVQQRGSASDLYQSR